MNSNFKIAAGLTALWLIATGCAVLTVDVDVYKGPLANTEEIQGEQVISLAMGAKPVLVQLRDHLEVPRDKRELAAYGIAPIPNFVIWDAPAHYQHRLMQFRTNPFYKAGYIPVATSDTKIAHIFTNEFSLRVNEILGLYDDRDNDELASLALSCRQLAQTYQECYRVIHPKSNWEGSNLWTSIQSKFKSQRFLETNYCQGVNLNELRQAYQRFFYHEVPDDNLFSYREVNELFPASDPGRINDRHTTMFERLAQDKADADASCLFTNDAQQEKAEFTTYVKRVSKSFLEGRSACHELLILALRAIPMAHDSTNITLDGRNALQAEAAKLGAKLIWRRQLARYLTNLTASCVMPDGTPAPQALTTNSPDLIMEFAINYETRLRNELGTNEYYESISSNAVQNIKSRHGFWATAAVALDTKHDAPPSDPAENVLEQLLKQDDGTLSRLLLTIDTELRHDSNLEDRFGLARGPVWTDVVKGLLQSFPETVLANTDGSLRRGRAPAGLERMIEQYLGGTVTHRTPEAWATNTAFLELLDSLSEFGEKVVWLANSTTLLQAGGDPDTEEYVRVLQSVGNSILVYVDELKAQAANRKELREKGPRFARAVVEAGFTNQIFKTWANSDPATNYDAKIVADQLVSVLRLEYLKQKQLEAQMVQNAKPKSRVQLTEETNVNLFMSLNDKGVVTNLALARATPFGRANAGGTNVIVEISVGADGKASNITPIIISAGTNTAAKPPANSNSDTNKPSDTSEVLLTVDASSQGIISNITASLKGSESCPPLRVSLAEINDIGADSKGVGVNLTISSNAMFVDASINKSNMPASLPANLRLTHSILLAVNVATNSLETQSAQVDKYQQVIDQAIEIRSGMIYLRPASSYLRSSYPSSTLLDDQGKVWHNMLLDQFLRSVPMPVPLIGDDLTMLVHPVKTIEARKNAETLSEIDKQSWQNINRIRVADAYKINYVIAKDDIGNWYVKGFSSDPTNVYSSMLKLAAFGAGGSFAGSATGLTTAAKSAASTTTSNSTATASSPATNASTNGVLTFELNLAGTNYFAQTTNVYSSLTNKVAGLAQSVQQRWTNSLDVGDTNSLSEVTKINQTAIRSVTQTVSLACKTISASGTNQPAALRYDEQIFNILQSVEQYGTSVCSQIGTTILTNNNARAKLQTACGAVVRDFLDQFIGQREQDIASYGSAINLINAAGSSK